MQPAAMLRIIERNMHTYLWLVTDAQGKESAQHVDAESAEGARSLLEARGYKNLRLQTDEIMSETVKGTLVPELDPNLRARLLQNRKRGLLWTCVLALKDWGLVILLFLGVAIWDWERGRIVRMFINVAALVAFVVVALLYRLPSYLFAKLNEAREWHRWEDVLATITVMEQVGKITKVKVKPVDLARYRAMAKIGLGQKDAAIEEYSRIAESAQPRWLFLSHLSGLYDLADDKDRAIACIEEAINLNPKPAALYIDLAWRVLHHKKDIVRGKAALDKAATMELTEIARPFMSRNRGILAFYSNQLDLARKELEEALAALEQRKSMVFAYSNTVFAKAYLCQVLAAQSQLNRAKQLYADIKPFLTAIKETQLLADCSRLTSQA
jgi:tetratricopeptide (TPR) repeat protein